MALPCLHAHAQHVLAGEIERDVFVLLKEAHLADALGGNAAGGDVGDRSGGELDARLRDVHFIGDHRNADGFQVGDRRIDQREQDIQIVNHHVVDHIDVEAARRKNAEAVNFEKHRARNDRLHRDDRGIEAFHVANLQDASGAFGGGDQSVGLVERGGHGLFDEHIDASFEKAAADAGVIFRGNGDADGVELFGEQVGFAAEMTRVPNSAATCAARVGIGVNDADEFRAFDLAPDAHVVPAELADAVQRPREWFFRLTIFSSLRLQRRDSGFRRESLDGDACIVRRRESARRARTAACGAHRWPAP